MYIPFDTQNDALYSCTIMLIIVIGNTFLSGSFFTVYIALSFSLNLTTQELVVFLQRFFFTGTFPPLPYYKSFVQNWREAMLVPPGRPVLWAFLPTAPNFNFTTTI